jgi:hypothetical protein
MVGVSAEPPRWSKQVVVVAAVGEETPHWLKQVEDDVVVVVDAETLHYMKQDICDGKF